MGDNQTTTTYLLDNITNKEEGECKCCDLYIHVVSLHNSLKNTGKDTTSQADGPRYVATFKTVIKYQELEGMTIGSFHMENCSMTYVQVNEETETNVLYKGMIFKPISSKSDSTISTFLYFTECTFQIQ